MRKTTFLALVAIGCFVAAAVVPFPVEHVVAMLGAAVVIIGYAVVEELEEIGKAVHMVWYILEAAGRAGGLGIPEGKQMTVKKKGEE